MADDFDQCGRPSAQAAAVALCERPLPSLCTHSTCLEQSAWLAAGARCAQCVVVLVPAHHHSFPLVAMGNDGGFKRNTVSPQIPPRSSPPCDTR
jgi:hypothetical protein